MERITNIPADAAIGRHCCETFRPLDEDGEPLYDEKCPGRKGAQVEVSVQLPIGDHGDATTGDETLRLDCAYSPMPDEGYVVVVRDVTARQRVADDKADILATVSHELRTPLAPIRGLLGMLTERDDELDDDQRRHAYEVMLREEQRLERLVHQLLQASSLEEAVFQVVPERIDWAKAVLEQVESIEREQPNREFSVTIEDKLPLVMADDQMAAQVLANLLSNAVKFSPERSPVDVSVEYARERVFTTITDEGAGIESDDRERIFDKFTRLGDRMAHGEQRVRARPVHRAALGRGDGRHGVGRRRADRRLRVHLHSPGGSREGHEKFGQDSVIVTLLIVTAGSGGPSSCGADARIFWSTSSPCVAPPNFTYVP